MPKITFTIASRLLQTGPPSFEWHILMEFCDRGSLSKALASFRCD
jgi:hypothetical protein